MKKFLYLISIVSLLLQSPLFAADQIIKPTVQFAEEGNWPPFTPDKYGYTKEGLSYILMQKIFSHLNIDVKLELFPQKRMLKHLELGKKDAVTVISKNESRLKYLDYSEPIFQKKGYIYYSKEKNPNFSWEKYADLKGLKIGVVLGHNLGNAFNQAIKEHNLDIYHSRKPKENFDRLLKGQVDIVLSIEPTANYILKDPKFGAVIAPASKKYYSKQYYIGFSKKSKAKNLLPKVNEVIKKMKHDGSLKELLSKYSLSF